MCIHILPIERWSLTRRMTHVLQDEADLVQELTLLDRARNLVCLLHLP